MQLRQHCAMQLTRHWDAQAVTLAALAPVALVEPSHRTKLQRPDPDDLARRLRLRRRNNGPKHRI
jgi:hypothetical protein